MLWACNWIFLFGKVWRSCNNKASHGQIIGSNEVTLGTLLGGTVLFLPVRQQKAKTIYRHLCGLKDWKKILYLQRVLWSCNNKTVTKGPYWIIVANSTLGGCVTVIGNGLDLGNGVSPSTMSRMATVLWPWPLMALMVLYLDLRPDTKHCFPNNKWQIYTRAFSLNCYWHCGLCLD